MEGNRPVTLVEPDGTSHEGVWAVRVDRGGGESVQADTQVGNWTIRWRVRQVGLENLDHTWNLVDGQTSQLHDIEAIRDVDRRFWILFTVARV